jgi:hypothetical protein
LAVVQWRQRDCASSSAACRWHGGGGSGGGGSATVRQRQWLLGDGVAMAWRQRQLVGVAAVAVRWRRTARRRQAMDGARARAIDGVTATLRRRNAQW